jgi:hypothetical protein
MEEKKNEKTNIYKKYLIKEFEKNNEEIMKMSNELKENGFIYFELPNELDELLIKLSCFTKRYFDPNNPRYKYKNTYFDKNNKDGIPEPPSLIGRQPFNIQKREISEKILEKKKDNKHLPLIGISSREFIDLNYKTNYFFDYDIFLYKDTIKLLIQKFTEFAKEILYQVLYPLEIDFEYLDSLLNFENSESTFRCCFYKKKEKLTQSLEMHTDNGK